MNRIHLFKAKRIDNREWVEGFYYCLPNQDIRYIHHIITGHPEVRQVQHYILPVRAGLSDEPLGEDEPIEVDPHTICQCVALPDIKGKIMFEEDIVESRDRARGVIKFGRYGDGARADYGFYIKWQAPKQNRRKNIYFWQKKIKVIGSTIDPALTEKEAIQRIKQRIATATDIAGSGIDGRAYDDMDMAIKALEEIQLYRAIGTVEECRAAVEKQKAEQPIRSYDDAGSVNQLICPGCYNTLKWDSTENRGTKHCDLCGQKIDLDQGDRK